MIKKKTQWLVTEYVAILCEYIKCHVHVTFTTDVTFLNTLPFMRVVGWVIGLVIVEYTPPRTAKQLATNLIWVCHLYYLSLTDWKTVMTHHHKYICCLRQCCHSRMLSVSDERKMQFKCLPHNMKIVFQYITLWTNAFLHR